MPYRTRVVGNPTTVAQQDFPRGLGPTITGVGTQWDVIAQHYNNPWMPSDPINEAQTVDVPALSPFIPVVIFKVPDREEGWLDGFCNGVDNPMFFNFLEWAIWVDRAPIPGFDLLDGQVGSFPNVKPFFWPLFDGQEVRVMVRSSAVFDIAHAAAILTGRTFPNEMIKQGV